MYTRFHCFLNIIQLIHHHTAVLNTNLVIHTQVHKLITKVLNNQNIFIENVHTRRRRKEVANVYSSSSGPQSIKFIVALSKYFLFTYKFSRKWVQLVTWRRRVLQRLTFRKGYGSLIIKFIPSFRCRACSGVHFNESFVLDFSFMTRWRQCTDMRLW